MRGTITLVSLGLLVACSGSEGPAGEPGEQGAQGEQGEQGEQGDPGAAATITPETAGANCPAGGVRIDTTASDPVYVCNGANADTTTANSWLGHQIFSTYELVCPAGFTSIAGGGRQLGCMQTAEEGTGSFYTAVDDCFQTYGATLPVYAEWYAAMSNFTLTGETGNWEWLASGDYWTQSGTSLAGSGALTDVSTAAPGSTIYGYRCWIPR